METLLTSIDELRVTMIFPLLPSRVGLAVVGLAVVGLSVGD